MIENRQQTENVSIMKHAFLFRLAATALLTTAAAGFTTQGQTAQVSTASAGEPALTVATRKAVHIKAVRDFSKKYPATNAASWYSTDNGGFIATFEQDKVKHILCYDKYGHWLSDEHIYDASLLNESIKKQVLSYYEEYVINNVVELKTPMGHVYLINIQNKDKTRSKTIRRTDDGEMELMTDLTNLP